jgi:hypothetical protein
MPSVRTTCFVTMQFVDLPGPPHATASPSLLMVISVLESAARWSLRRHVDTLTMAWLTSMFIAKP